MRWINSIIDFFTSLLCKKHIQAKEKTRTTKVINHPSTQKQVQAIECNLYLQPTKNMQTPYLNAEIAGKNRNVDAYNALGTFFGKDIKYAAVKQMLEDIRADIIPLPLWQISPFLTSDEGAFHDQGCIYINENFIFNAENSPKNTWLLFRVMIEEIGHYVDYLLRNKYDTIQGDAKGDEGTRFAADFIEFNHLLTKDFYFATFKIVEADGTHREFRPKVMQKEPAQESKAKDLLYVEDKNDDRAAVILNNGKQVIGEFFKIRGAGAIHENLTQQAANQVNIIYDYRLDEGCAWPDVPCNNEYSIETCYFNTWRDLKKQGTLAYESHHGKNQYWHSMAPTGNHTNQEVVELIIAQTKQWFTMGVETGMGDGGFWNKAGDDGLFHIGKILHTIQDAFSSSHIQRNSSNHIIQIQGYNTQDARKHGKPDKEAHSKGANDALKYSMKVLTLYKVIKAYDKELQVPNLYLPQFETLLRDEIYMIKSDSQHLKAGGTLAEYANGGNN